MISFALLIAIALLPGLILSMVGLPGVTSITTLATLGALIPALLGTRWIAVATLVGMVVASAAAPAAATDPWLAAILLALVGAATGITTHWGSSGLVSLAAISIVFLVCDPPSLPQDPSSGVMMLLLVGASGLWGLAAGWLIRHLRAGAGKPLPPQEKWDRTVIYAGTLTVTLGIGAYYVVATEWGHTGAWFLMTFLIILQPYLQDAYRHTVGRAIGTVGGVLLAVVVLGLAEGNTIALYVIGSASAVAALTLRFTTKRPYWQYVVLLTPAVVILEGIGASITDTAVNRLIATLAAAAISIVIEAVLTPLFRRSARIHNLDRY